MFTPSSTQGLEPTTTHQPQADEEEDIGLVGQQGLLPTKSDARLWAVQCRPGCEREAVVCLLQKAVEFAARNERLGMGALGIKSAFAHDHIKVGHPARSRQGADLPSAHTGGVMPCHVISHDYAFMSSLSLHCHKSPYGMRPQPAIIRVCRSCPLI